MDPVVEWGPSLPGWWTAQRVDSRPAARVRRDARAERVRVLVVAGSTVAAAAAEVGVSQWSAFRYLQAGRRQDGRRQDGPARTGRPGAAGTTAPALSQCAGVDERRAVGG